MPLSNLNRLSIKLPLFVSFIIMLVAGGLSFYAFSSSRDSTVKTAEAHMSVILEKKQSRLMTWYNSLDAMLQTLGTNPNTLEAATNIDAMWQLLDTSERQKLRESFTTQNPHAFEDRRNLMVADTARGYDILHKRHHLYYNKFIEQNALYDLFLINLDGDIVYSVVKENDFGQNVLQGQLANSGIAEAFRHSRETSDTSTFFSSFAAYEISNGAMASFASMRIETAEKELKGILVIQINQESFQSVINNTTGMGETGQAYIVDKNGVLLVDSRFENGPKAFDRITLTPQILAALDGNKTQLQNGVGLKGEPVKVLATHMELHGTPYALITEKTHAEIFQDLYKQRNTLTTISVLSATVLILLSWLYISRITSSLDRLGREMAKISEGDYKVEVTAIARKDEIGSIAQVLVGFRAKLQDAANSQEERDRALEEQNKTLEVLRNGLVQLAEGDLSKPINQQFSKEYESLRADFNRTLSTLSDAISSVMEASESIQHGAQEISQASDDLSNRTENQAATLEQTAAALDQLTASVKSAAEGARSVETIVLEAQSEAEASGKVVSDAIAAMNQIEGSSKHISQIISVIDDIAFQTNLLALNAGVEAARAGDAGKGFAVVASEVRALAQRSSEAAKEIKTLISGSAKEVGRGVELVGGAGEALTSIVKRVSHISDLVRTMATGTSEQAVGLGEINIGVNQLDQVTQQNAAMVEESTAASHVLKADALRLQEMVKRFKTSGRPMALEPIPFQRSMTEANVNQVQFKPSAEVSFTPKQSEMVVEPKKTGTTNAAAPANDWIDF